MHPSDPQSGSSDVGNPGPSADRPATADPLGRSAERSAVLFAMTLSLGVGLLMFSIKVGGYLLTNSAAILGDAGESVVHVAAVTFAFFSLRYSYRPPDQGHPYGHAKISFFSAGFEGAMILCAALYILYEAIYKWSMGLMELQNLELGTLLTALAMLTNGALGGFLIWTGRRYRSLILIANGKHVLTDCWTSLGVVVGLTLTQLTGWLAWDPLAAIFVALNIMYSGVGLVRQSFQGLMDTADPAIHQRLIELLDRETGRHQIAYHELRHRSLGSVYWVDVHLLFAQSLPIGHAHRIATAIEQVLEESLEPPAHVTTHLEALEDHNHVHPQAGE